MPTSTQPTPSHACVLVVPPLLQGASIIRPGKQQSRRAGSPSTTRSLRVALARNTLCVVLVWVSMAGGCRQQPAARRMAGGSSLLLAALAKGPAAGGDGDIDWRGGVFQPCADVRQNLRTPLVWVSMTGGCQQQQAARRMAGGSSLLLAALAKGPAAGGDGDIDWRGGMFQPCADVRQNLRTPLCACWQPFSCFAL
jgi:hypothetical protein